jgi:hypothetical protein
VSRVVTILCLAGAAGVWAWALYWPKEATLEPLPSRFVGEYQVAGIHAPQGMLNPLPPGKQYVFRFAPEGTYSFSVFLNGGYEILRWEGVVAVSETGIMTLTPISKNRVEMRPPPEGSAPELLDRVERFHAEWGKDDKGPFLALRHADRGITLQLR